MNLIPIPTLAVSPRATLRSLLLYALFASSPTCLAAQAAQPTPAAARQMHDAIAAAQAGHETQALTIVDTLLATQPRFVPGLKLQGMLLEDLGRQPEAARAYAAALALAPADPEMLLKLGTIELLTNHPDRAATLLEHRLRLTPADEETSYYLAQALHLQGQNDRALAVLKAAIDKRPGTPPLWQKYGELLLSAGRNDEALTWLLKARHAEPASPRIDFDLAVATSNSMELTQARDFALAQARATPQDIDNLLLLATIQVKLADWPAADTNLQRVVGLRPNDAAALVALGHCELELQRYPTAIDALQRALAADPTQILAHFFLARAYTAQGNTEASQHQAALYRELQQHPAYTASADETRRQQLILAQARQLLTPTDGTQPKEPEALKLLATSEHGPNTTPGSPWVSLGATYLAMGNTADASRSFTHALQLDPATPNAHTYLGYLALQQGELPQAEAAFQAELTHDPNQAFATAELGEVRYRQQRYAEAAALLAKSKTTSPTLLYLLCDAWFRLNKPEKATLIAETIATFAAAQPEIMPPLETLLRRNNQDALANRLAATSPQLSPPTPRP